MPTTSDTSRKDFLASLTADQKTAFKELEELVHKKPEDIGWHYQVGLVLQRMFPHDHDAPHVQHGGQWFKKLAAVLNRTPGPFYKEHRFAAEFKQGEVKRLRAWEEDGRMTWTHITFAFPVETAKRWQLLERAVEEGWNSEDMKYQVKQQVEPKRPPVGGRPPRKADSSEAALQKFNALSSHWLRYSRILTDEFDRLVHRRKTSRSGEQKDALDRLLTTAKQSVQEIGKRAGEIQKSLAEFR